MRHLWPPPPPQLPPLLPELQLLPLPLEDENEVAMLLQHRIVVTMVSTIA
jgi:hypothetical protein